MDLHLAHTVIYVHGIDNKPAEDILNCQWDRALFGHRMGDRTRMAYWVNHRRHGPPSEATCDESDYSISTAAVNKYSILSASSDPEHERLIQELSGGDRTQDNFLRDVRTALEDNAEPHSVGAKGIDGAVWTGLSWVFTRAFLRDVHDFFFDKDERERMRNALLDTLSPGGAPFVVIAHSQGSMIAYDVLRELDPKEYPVALLVTIGSPLGLPPVRTRFKKWTSEKNLRVPNCVKEWINISNRGDMVCADLDLSDDIKPKTRFKNFIVNSPNEELQDDKHSSTGYLRLPEVRLPVLQATGQTFTQPIGLQVIAADLDEQLKTRSRIVTHPVLIELVSKRSGNGHEDVTTIRNLLREQIEKISRERTDGMDHDVDIEELRYWLAASLTREEIERLRTEFKSLRIQRIWRNSSKHALVNVSSAMVQAKAANYTYAALGEGITWAVLDTGIRADHPHFSGNDTVTSLWDCTTRGPARMMDLANEDPSDFDPNGHGTHVAGIIAGNYKTHTAPEGEPNEFSGMAPRAKIIGFKVLDAAGEGRDSWIIKSLDTISSINERAGRPVIQGINLSLGSKFDPSIYGCGYTPLCKELKRLWRQGVIVVLAAGNEGYAVLRTSGGSAWPSNMDLSIGDPANLEDAIAVGSVHRENPHTYGISYFSSRGPTADGRYKPDVVAPGEKILSARHDWHRASQVARTKGRKSASEAPLTHDGLYVEMSGTSMAAPHVSGLLAAFLSVRSEFIGEPDRIKKILLDNCVDLNRDRYVQGQGMPNLIRMLANT